jgi:1-acyl-sn-glycerol-3-phosphate acyltransferase
MAETGLGSPLRAFRRLSLYAGFTLPLMAWQRLALALGLPVTEALPAWYHRQCCRILGITVRRRGRPSRHRPTLFAANHVSYLDIAVLGGLVRGSFVAKSEVRSWPLFGLLAELQSTIFVERRAQRTRRHRDAMAERLAEGRNLILFPEGTSSDGNRVLPFKSALLSVAETRPGGGPLVVQPVSITYTRLDGIPLGRHLRPLCAWYGDMDLAPHLWQLAGLGRLTAVVQFHPPVTLADFGSRKALADHCQAAAARGVAAALTGRRIAETTQGGAGAVEDDRNESRDVEHGTEATV